MSFSMTIWLTLLWVAVFGSLDPIIIVSGIVLALAIQKLFPLPAQKGLWRFRPWYALILLLRFIWDMSKAAVQVSAVVLWRSEHDDGLVRCDLRTDNPVYMTIVAAMTSMIPGTIVVEASRKDKALYLHCLDLEHQGGVEGIKQATWAQEARVLRAFAPKRVLEEAGMKE